ncbi:MAG: dTMP kinase [Hyphomonadaceae bacterium]
MTITNRGRFITLEGGEGSGKSTLLTGLTARTEALGIQVVRTREPGGTPLAESVRALALHPPDGQNWSPLAEALLMNAARASHLDELIRPSLDAGHWVLCDRFSDSTLAYQSVGGVPMATLRAMETSVLKNTAPDLTLILDAAPEDLIERRRSRGEALDVFEARPQAFHTAVRNAFVSIAHSDPSRYVLIDALASADDVLDAAWSAIAERFTPAHATP